MIANMRYGVAAVSLLALTAGAVYETAPGLGCA